MNNYCTNCGKKLEENSIKCEKCNTYVIDLKSVNKKKIFKIIISILIFIIVGIILGITIYSLYYKNLSKSLYKNYIKNDYKEAIFDKYTYCRACDGSCDGGCFNSPKIVGCFKYFYKSNPNLNRADIVVISNRGKIFLDNYSYIVNKYGFQVEYPKINDDKYETENRSNISILVNSISIDSIENIYKMITELIDSYHKNGGNEFRIDVTSKFNNNSIRISNAESSNKNDFIWVFNYDRKMTNPSLEEIKPIYESPVFPSDSLDNGNYNND